MKKASVYILVAVLCLGVFTGCSRRNDSGSTDPSPTPVITASPDTIVPNTDGTPDGNDNGMNNVIDDAANGVQDAVDGAANAVEDMLPDADNGKIEDGDKAENGTDADNGSDTARSRRGAR